MKSSQLSLLALLAMVGCENRSDHSQAVAAASNKEWSYPVWSDVKRIPVDTSLLPRYPEIVGSRVRPRLFFQAFQRNGTGLSSPRGVYEFSIFSENSNEQPVSVSSAGRTSSARVTVDSSDVLHMAFGKAVEAKGDNPRLFEPSEILYSNTIGDKWNQPISLFKALHGGAVILSSPLVAARDGSMHLAWFVMHDSVWTKSGPSVLYRRTRPGKGWSELVRIGTGMQPSLQTTPNGDVYLAYARTGDSKFGVLQVMRSTDHGATWQVANSIKNGAGSITSVLVASSTSGKVAVIWGVDKSRNGLAETFFSTVTDDGKQWSSPLQIFEPNGGISFSFDARFDANDKLYLVFDRSPGLVKTPRYLQECIYDNGSWHGPHDILGLREVSTKMKLAQTNGKLYLSLYAADAPGGPGMVIAHVEQASNKN